MTPAALKPLMNVEERDGRWFALTPESWLAGPGLERFAGRWMRLTYHAGLFDEHVRPLVRFARHGGEAVTMPMNGALTGVGIWTGRVPDDTVAVAFSPARRPGAFSFAPADASAVSRPALLWRGLRRDWRLAATACGARMIGAREEARHCLSFAALATSLDRYEGWEAARRRPIDLGGFDRPHARWADGPVVRVLIGAGAADAVRRTRDSVEAQSYPRWAVDDGDGAAGELAVAVAAGDQFPPHAFASVVEHLAANPELDACYGDEEDAAGGAPRLKPDFDPVLAASSGYEGTGLFRRAEVAVPERIGHVRRLLLRRAFRPVRREGAPAAPAPIDLPAITAVIPTRDRPGLLAACLAGLAERTRGVALEVVIVDNGSRDPHALRILDEAARRPGVRVLRDARPFDFAALCNAGAALATTRFLLFLNNDVAPATPDWAARLAAWAARPEVGAVGARLTYPDGRLQHGGVVVGLGGTALHLHHRTRDGEGYLGMLAHARAVGAVTGAVLMVERAKFEAVGGFDAAAFPVLLNDVDLCLRLAARGWRTIYEPAATLTHLESASRGRSARPLRLHAAERARFAARWVEAIRDDPHFHPALSLTSTDPALG